MSLVRSLSVPAFVSAFAATAIAQDGSTVRGDYTRIAACVWRALDEEKPGLIQLTDLRGEDTIIITFDSPAGAGMSRSMKASFAKAAGDQTSIQVEGPAPGYWPSKVRPIAQQCSANLAPKPAARAK